MGRAQHAGPRAWSTRAFDRLLAPRVRVVWVLTVVEETGTGVVQRGLFAGTGGSTGSGGAAYRAAAALSARCNITTVAAAAPAGDLLARP